MEKTLALLLIGMLSYGCADSTPPGPEELVSSGTVINGFGDEPRILTSSSMVRVGTYFDFSMYDSLGINFSATRLSTERPFDVIEVKIGPATYVRDTLYTTPKDVSIRLSVSRLQKPKSSALTFWTNDPQTILSLSNLRVVGWTKP